jgi:hypothetical protein
MKISADTLTILKNFSDINKGIHFKKDAPLATWHPQKYVLAEATIKEQLTKDFTVFDLGQLLSVSSLFESPDFEFQSDKIEISSGNRSVNFLYAEPSLVLDPENRVTKYRENAIQGCIASATLTKEDLKSLKQAAAILALPDITISGKDNVITFSAQDSENSGTNSFRVDVPADVQKEFRAVMRCEHFKVLDGNYEFISHPKLAYFKHTTIPVEYWIAYQAD